MKDARKREDRAARPLVVVITGPSSAGKSSLVQALEPAVEGAQTVSLDLELEERMPKTCPCRNLKEAELFGFTVDVYHEHLRALAQRHGVVFCDHVLCGNAAWTGDLQTRLADMDLYLVELFCEKDILEAREHDRPDRPGLPEHALWQAEWQARNPCEWASLRLDSGKCSTAELAARVLEGLKSAHPALSFATRRPEPGEEPVGALVENVVEE